MEIRSFTPQEMDRLLNITAPVYLSLYLHIDTATLRAKKTRTAHLLRAAREQLLKYPLDDAEIDTLLEPVRREIDDVEFWRERRGTLALFRTPDEFIGYQIPLPLKERVMLGRQFFIKPLLPLLTWARPFYVLAVSQRQVRLLECTYDQCRELEVEGMPHDMRQALGAIELEKQQQLRTTPAMFGAGGSPAIHYGVGGGQEEHKELLERYLRMVDSALQHKLADAHAPMVIAGVEYVFALYRQLTAYPNLVPFAVKGNADRMRAATLHQRARRLLDSYFQEPKCHALAQYRELKAAGRTFSDTASILHAAEQGRIESLIVDRVVEEWGEYDAKEGQVMPHPHMGANGTELSNLAVIQTLKNKGTAFALDGSEMPAPVAMVAVLRY